MKINCLRSFYYLSTLLVLAACASSTQSGLVGANRKQALLVPSAQIEAGAQQAYAEVLAEAKAKGVLNQDKSQTERVRAIAQRLIPKVDAFRTDALGWKWEVNLISEDTLNAWCMPGGKIVFYTGIINQLKLSDDEIAAIMGHEIAHALREHSRERASEQVLTQSGLQIGAALLGLGQAGTQNLAIGTQLLVGLPNSRAHETEADRIGVELAARAGYNPQAAVNVWQKMAQASGGRSQPEFMSTHPSSDSRIKDLTQYAARVQPLYQAVPKK